MFSRKDNMVRANHSHSEITMVLTLATKREHYKKIHESPQNNLFPRPCRRRTKVLKESS
jgi:hypothetical protein